MFHIGPIYSVKLEKTMQNTGSKDRPFYAKAGEHKYYRLFGILIKEVTITGDFPDPDDKK